MYATPEEHDDSHSCICVLASLLRNLTPVSIILFLPCSINIWVISWKIYSQNFFSTKHFFLPFYFENNRHVFFFQCDTWKFRDIIFLSLALGKIFFFQQLTVKAVLTIKCNPCTWNVRKSTSFQKSYSTHFVVFFVITK